MEDGKGKVSCFAKIHGAKKSKPISSKVLIYACVVLKHKEKDIFIPG